MTRCHGTTKPPLPHARLHREHNAAAASLCMHPPSLLFTGRKDKCVLMFASFVR